MSPVPGQCYSYPRLLKVLCFFVPVITTILTCLFLLAITIQLGYVLYFFGYIFQNHKVSSSRDPVQPVSVIICAHNEAVNLRRNLPLILSQRYENEAGKCMYEVIVVNDASSDNTAEVLNILGRNSENLKIVTVLPDEPRNLPGKKFAQCRGVAAAAYDLLLMTDADCIPASNEWLAMMTAPLLEGKELVTGVGKYLPGRGMLNAFIRWETMHTFLQYSSYANVNEPYMAVGRNLACTKAAYLRASRSDAWDKLPSGDDDLLVTANAKPGNTALVHKAGAFTLSAAKDSWQDWINQKQRHLSVGKYYKPAAKAILAIHASAHALVWLCFLGLLFTPNWPLALGCMGVRSAVYWMVWAAAAGKLRERGLILWFPLFDIGWMVYNFAFSPYIIFKSKQTWK